MLNRRIAALERSFAEPFQALQNKQQELTRMVYFLLGHLLVNGHLDPSMLEDLEGPLFWPRATQLIKGFEGHPGLTEARKHLPRSPTAWQAWDENPEAYLRACDERERVLTSNNLTSL